ncbi:MAG: Re/Si-specific NAD(P)(+) transhydrogenase subunit alpha [Myxococcales bacterium]|nr:Re/Si-specific NAD(P)(+) transhydrogenase subunit alpha [Myxococcales bacterium]
MHVFIPKECADGETRVAATPETVKLMKKAGLDVAVERGAGHESHFADEAYEAAGATLADDAAAEWRKADLVLKVSPPADNPRLGAHEASLAKEGAVVLGFMKPYEEHDMLRTLLSRKVTSLSMELVPRITRAQKMDALSSQASIGGYKAVVLAAAHLPKYFPLLMTAAGTIKPAKVVVMGAGVAGLQAIATAKRLGAVVFASDIRAAVKEQIESLGGKFIPLPESEESGEGKGGYARQVSKEYLAEQQRIVHEYLVEADVVICTALVPGRKAPVLVKASSVEAMKPGAVIVDMAVAQGGNCELSEEGKDVVKHGVLIIGHPNLPATMPYDASLVYSRNVWALVDHIVKDGALVIDSEEEVTTGCLLTHAGKVHHAPTREAMGLEAEETKPEPETKGDDEEEADEEEES